MGSFFCFFLCGVGLDHPINNHFDGSNRSLSSLAEGSLNLSVLFGEWNCYREGVSCMGPALTRDDSFQNIRVILVNCSRVAVSVSPVIVCCFCLDRDFLLASFFEPVSK